ncbi:MAG: hypothetical protein SGJ09_13205 [Phycisphaerae bacterium]|nr:hypothetical protein [Phycisphaerae bacterium]
MRTSSPISLLFVLASAISAAGVVGCSSHTESFPGKSRDQVWTAMLAAANEPTYKNWHVIENDVWAYEADSRIEIWRLLRRYKDSGAQWPRLEDSEWTFSVVLEATEPPSASFTNRSMGIPSHGWEQTDRYFEQVWEILGGRSANRALTPAAPRTTVPAVPSPEPNPVSPSTAPAEPPVDIPNNLVIRLGEGDIRDIRDITDSLAEHACVPVRA